MTRKCFRWEDDWRKLGNHKSRRKAKIILRQDPESEELMTNHVKIIKPNIYCKEEKNEEENEKQTEQ